MPAVVCPRASQVHVATLPRPTLSSWGACYRLAGIEERLRQQVLEAHDLADLEPSQWAYMVPRRILFSIESALKFGPELQVQILSPVFPNTCGSALLGQPYVVYARKKDSTFSTHLCFGTRLLSEASEDLQYLQRLQCSEMIREICGPVTTAESEPPTWGYHPG